MKSFKQFFVEREEGKAVAFAYGRFNPPTIGHEKLIDTVIQTAKAHGADYFIIPSKSSAKQTPAERKKNPLSLQERTAILKYMVPNPDAIVDFGATFIDALKKFQEMGYTTVYHIAGSDREQSFMIPVNKYNGKPDQSGNIPFHFQDYVFISAGQRDPDSEGVEGMSASKLRQLAVDGDYETFKTGMSQSVPDNLKKQAFETIRKMSTKQ